jgi:hypothetical protein
MGQVEEEARVSESYRVFGDFQIIKECSIP